MRRWSDFDRTRWPSLAEATEGWQLPAVTDSTDPRWAERRQRVFQVLGAFFVGSEAIERP